MDGLARSPNADKGVVDQESTPDLRSLLGTLESSMPNVDERNSGTRERVLKAAIETFADRGFRSTTMRDLAASVGIKAPGLYAHFSSKEEILSQAMLRALIGFLRYMTAEEVCSTPRDLLEMTVRRHVLHQLANPSTTRANDLLLATQSLAEFLPPESYTQVRRVQRGYYLLVKERIRDALPSDSSVDPGVTAFAVINMCDLVTSWFRTDGEQSQQEIADYYWFLTRGMLRIQ